MIPINIWRSGSGRNAVINISSGMVGSNYYESSRLLGTKIAMTNQEYLESQIQNILTYLSPTFKRIYGREMTKYDIEGVVDDRPVTVATNAEPINDTVSAMLYEQKSISDALAEQARQLALKSSMLQSETAIFSSPDEYQRMMDDTNAQIRAYNDGTQSSDRTAAAPLTYNIMDAGSHSDLEAAGDTTQVPSKDDSAWLILLLPIALLVVVILYITKGGKA